MKVNKWIIIAISALIVLAIGGWIYEQITSGRTIDLLNTSVADYVRANTELRGQLDTAITENGELATALGTAEDENNELRERLEASAELIDSIIEAGQETAEGIGAGLGETTGIRADNLYVARQIRDGFKIIERLQGQAGQQ